MKCGYDTFIYAVIFYRWYIFKYTENPACTFSELLLHMTRTPSYFNGTRRQSTSNSWCANNRQIIWPAIYCSWCQWFRQDFFHYCYFVGILFSTSLWKAPRGSSATTEMGVKFTKLWLNMTPHPSYISRCIFHCDFAPSLSRQELSRTEFSLHDWALWNMCSLLLSNLYRYPALLTICLIRKSPKYWPGLLVYQINSGTYSAIKVSSKHQCLWVRTSGSIESIIQAHQP